MTARTLTLSFALALILGVGLTTIHAQNVAGGTVSGTTLAATNTTSQITLGGASHLTVLSFTAPAAASQTLTFPDPTGADSVAYLALAQTFTNKTLTAPALTSPTVDQLISTTQKVLLKGTGTGATQVAMSQTTPPTCSSSCGTTVPAIVGTDSAGIVQMGSGGSPASGWVVSFNGTWAAAPSCVVTSYKSGMVIGKLPIVVVTTTGGFTVTTNGTAPSTGDQYAYTCFGTQ